MPNPPSTEPTALLPDRRTLDRARLSRDPRFDGRFFIAVTSTGIYCRPVCPAPSPKQANVRYFPSAAAAAEAGFRPCLRCRPEAAPGTPAWLGTSAVVRRALRLIQEGALDESSVDRFAARVGIGSRHLHRLFVQHVGASPIAVAQTRRLHFAKRLLDETSLTMTDIALASGYGSLRRFNDAFRAAYGRAPRDLRRDRAGGYVSAHGQDRALSGPQRPSSDADAQRVTLRLAFRPPYDWGALRDFLVARAVPGVERIDVDGYARTIALPDAGSRPGAPALIRVRPIAGRDELELTVYGASPPDLFQLSVTARRMFDLGADPVLTAQALGTDAVLRRLVRRRPGLRVPGMWDPFECAVRAVLGQQVSVAAARTLAGRLVARVGRRVPGVPDDLTHLFPSPADLAEADLGGLGVTGARIAAIQTLARTVLEGRLDFRAPADEVITTLQTLPGFGPWTAHYVAMRALGEPDALPAADIVLRRMAAGGASPLMTRELEQRAEAWRPWRSYAVMHLWRAAGDASVTPRRGCRSPASTTATEETHDDVLA